MKRLFTEELDIVVETGKCPLNLYQFMILVRAATPFETQEVEGMANVLQHMCPPAPGLRIHLASARMALKKGDAISVIECVDFHGAANKALQDEEHLLRFAPLGDLSRSPELKKMPPPRPCVCEHLGVSPLAARFARACRGIKPRSANTAWSFTPLAGERKAAFIMGWAFRTAVFGVIGE
eukprot:6186711-Pyramimonas_sp.AAC.1